jgi:hypothetical protein
MIQIRLLQKCAMQDAYNLHICYSYGLSHFYYKSGQERIGNPDLETQATWNTSESILRQTQHKTIIA